MLRILLLLLLLSALVLGCQHEPFPPPPQQQGQDSIPTPDPDPQSKPCHPDSVYYARDIQPVLSASCAFAGCHDGGTASDGVDLSSYQAVMQSEVVRPGRPENSDLYEVINDSDPDKRMPPPPRAALPQKQIESIKKWIEQGAQNLQCDACDTATVSYAVPVAGLVAQNCLACHSGPQASSGLLLSDYDALRDAFLNTNLLERIQAQPGVPVMPPGGRMNDCQLETLLKWYREGMQP